jgi:hypothetical protein
MSSDEAIEELDARGRPWASARQCKLFDHAAVAVTDSACLVPELEQRALDLDWLRVALDAGRTALLLINDRAYVWAASTA